MVFLSVLCIFVGLWLHCTKSCCGAAFLSTHIITPVWAVVNEKNKPFCNVPKNVQKTLDKTEYMFYNRIQKDKRTNVLYKKGQIIMNKKFISAVRTAALVTAFFLLGKGIISLFMLVLAIASVFAAYYIYSCRDAASRYERETYEYAEECRRSAQAANK